MLELPAVFHKSGLIPTLITIAVVCLLAALCSLYMAQAIARLPGNENYQQQVEYSEAFARFWSSRQWRTPYFWTQISFYICVTSLNISSLVDSAQVLDSILANVLGSTMALQMVLGERGDVVYWSPTVNCDESQRLKGECLPFQQQGDGDDDGVLITAGYILSVVLFMPLALMNLKVSERLGSLPFL